MAAWQSLLDQCLFGPSRSQSFKHHTMKKALCRPVCSMELAQPSPNNCVSIDGCWGGSSIFHSNFFLVCQLWFFFFLDEVILDNRSNNSTVCCPESLCFPTAQEGLGWPSALDFLLQIQAALIKARVLCIRTPCDFLSIPGDREKVLFSAWYVSFLLLQLTVWSTLIKAS